MIHNRIDTRKLNEFHPSNGQKVRYLCDEHIWRGLKVNKCGFCDGYIPAYKVKKIIWVKKGSIWIEWKEDEW